MLLSLQAMVGVAAALVLVAAPGGAEVPCLDVSGCAKYYYTLGAMIYEVVTHRRECLARPQFCFENENEVPACSRLV